MREVKNMKCLLCEKEFKSLQKHLRVHKTSMLEYLINFKLIEINIIDLYQSGQSLNFIFKKINEIDTKYRFGKGDISRYLKRNNVQPRKTSQAMKEYFNKNDVWNKGLTKEDHPSIMSYSLSRIGLLNPCFTLTEEERRKSYYWLSRSEQELTKIHSKISDTLKDGYQSGRILHYSVTNPNEYAIIHKKMMDGWRSSCKISRTFLRVSSHEERVMKALVTLNVKFTTQKRLGTDRVFHYDFFLDDHDLVVEINGDFWHCNPKDYVGEYWHSIKEMNASEIWEYDKVKKEYALNLNKKYTVIWESKINEVNDEELVGLLNEIIQNPEHNKEVNRRNEKRTKRTCF